MKKKYSKPILKLIKQQMAERWPEFAVFECPDKMRVAPLVSFRWEIPSVTKIFLEVTPDPKGYDRFLCDFAWSSIKDYPTIDIFRYRFPILEPEKAFSDAETYRGIEGVWGGQSSILFEIPTPTNTFRAVDYKDDLDAGVEESRRRRALEDTMTDEECEKLVAPVVDDLFAKLEQHVIPYLRKYAEYTRKSKQA